MYNLYDRGSSSNMTCSLSLADEQCPPHDWEVEVDVDIFRSETMADVNLCFALFVSCLFLPVK